MLMLTVYTALVLVVAVLLAFEIIRQALILLLLLLPLEIAWFALVARRLHDRGKSAWWLVLFVGAPNLLIPLGESSSDFAIVFALANLVIIVWGWVEIGFRRGTPGPNRFGPDPLERNDAVPSESVRPLAADQT
jgi:uncharacterized membrane protein YhaH (DUF805 family)